MDLIKFQFDGQTVTPITVNGNPWFVAKEIAGILGYADTQTMTRRLDEDEKGMQDIHTLGGLQSVTIINESGLYNAIIGSNKPNARAFKKWITSEVIPSIRKTGGYSVNHPELLSVEVIETLLHRYKQEKSRADNLELVNEEMRPQVKLLQKNLESPELVGMNKIAADLNISAIALNKFLHESKICYKEGKTWLPFIDWRDCGLFKLDKFIQVFEDGSHTRETLKATQRGRLFILELYRSDESPKAVYRRLFEQLQLRGA